LATLLSTATNERVKTGNKPDNFHRLSPSASISIQPISDEQFYLRALYKSTFRLPSFNDLYYYRLGNRSLNPETADEYNIGVTWSKSLFSFMDYLTITIDGYYNNVKDKIVAFPGTYTWRMVNYGKVRITGVDLTLASAFKLSRGYNLIISGAYTWQKAIELTDPTSKNYKDQLPYTPVNSGNISAIMETPWVNIGYSVVGVGKRYYLAQNISANEIPGYTDQTLSLSHEFHLKDYSFNLQGEILNLANKQYDVIKYYPMPGRSWRISGTFKF
jgi:outer membrane receptor protein involved in Fe transport